MDIRYFRYFLIVAEKQSISEAARAIFMDQSGLSKIISKMENHYGVALISRTPQGIKLTPSGQLLLEEARGIIKHYEKSLNILQSDESPTLSICYTVGLGRWLLPETLRSFCTSHPSVNLDLRYCPLNEFDRVLPASDADIVVLPSFFYKEKIGYKSLSLMNDIMTLVVNQRNPFSSQSSLRASDISEFPIVFIEGVAMYNTIDIFKEAGVNVRIQKCPNEQTIDTMVRSGLAGAIRNKSSCKENPDLCYIPFEDIPPTELIALVKEDNRKPEVTDFIHHLKHVLWHNTTNT